MCPKLVSGAPCCFEAGYGPDLKAAGETGTLEITNVFIYLFILLTSKL